ncbi:class I SAM-dependent methyltransferase [Streptomyces sp. CA-111067]|uniref:class I SAM-dependent methyltransferase n=1 Tax=Streptomyces sp. CA-111067 TaxID=3240046 RepID=UPI003D99FD9F
MTTLPPGGPGDPGARPVAESFGSAPERYDRARPRYPEALAGRVLAGCPGRDVLDVGIGTGIVARLFRAAGCRVLGVDADPRMAAYARGEGFEASASRFEDWDPAGRQFDAVVSGQTWHWLDPVAGAAQAARVLRPGGRLAVFWNADRPPAGLAAAFGEAYGRLLPESLSARRWTTASSVAGYARLAAKAAEGMRGVGGFEEPEEWRFAWQRPYTREEWLDQVPTTGDHTRFPPERVADLLGALGAAIDAAGGTFTMRYTTVATTATRTLPRA